MENRHRTAVKAWVAAREAGVRIIVVKDSLELEAPRKPPDEILHALTAAREELVILLRQQPGKLCGLDYVDLFEERAAFGEHEAGRTRYDAELNAFECCVSLWMSQNNPDVPDRYRCIHCGGETGDESLALALQSNGRHAWIHSACHRPFLASRRVNALEALSGFGIYPPSNSAGHFGKKAG
ncbi:MAG: hypothetical protein ACK6DM_01965 [Alphaproteobacteria bacterium]|jgi:hypothetical protein